MEFEKIDINELIEYENNCKIHSDEQIEQICKSIKEFGNNDPIGIDENNMVLEGHGRLYALKKLGYKEVPVVRISNLTEQEKKAYILAHNKLTINTGFDNDILKLELDSIDEFDMSEFGFEIEDYTEYPEETEEDLEEVLNEEVPEELGIRQGDIFKLGNHVLMCGDSTDIDCVKKLTGERCIDLVFTDPPYGVMATGGRSQTKEKLNMINIENDDLKDNDLIKFLTDCFLNFNLKENGSAYICYSWQTQMEFTQAIINSDLSIKNCIIWVKENFGLNGHKGYRPQHEMIYFCCKNNFEWLGNNSQSNVWNVNKEIKRELQGNHPTPKPRELVKIAINNSSKKGDKVLDLFGGSGTTLIACEETGRSCYMMEYEPKYIDVIIRRWEKLTGKKAEKIS